MNVTLLHRGREYQSPGSAMLFRDNWISSLRSVVTLDHWTDLIGHKGCVNTINFNHSGDLLISGSDDGKLKIWNVATQKCVESFWGHYSNVFAAKFMFQSDRQVISGGNDSETRHYDIERKICTTYLHHNKKVLSLSVDNSNPSTFLSSSADGTIGLIDIRLPYQGSKVGPFLDSSDILIGNRDDWILPQALGGGRLSQLQTSPFSKTQSATILDYHQSSQDFPKRPLHISLYNVQHHPLDFNKFIVCSSHGDVRLFDLRKLVGIDPWASAINLYRRSEKDSREITGCAFSKNGAEIVTSTIHGKIHLFDTESDLAQPLKKFETLASVGDQFVWTGSQAEHGRRLLTKRERHFVQRTPKPKKRKIGNEFVAWTPIVDRIPDRASRLSPDITPGLLTIRDHRPKSSYDGHISEMTIKGVGFYGPRDEYIISGSDDARVFIWDKKSGAVVTCLEGHDEVVNCVVSHPFQPMIATSGIDSCVKLWQNYGNFPNEKDQERRHRILERILQENSPNQIPLPDSITTESNDDGDSGSS